jgi:hypothetical protein
MGWLFMSSLGQYASPKAYLDAQFTFENGDGTSKILASALVNRRTWYAACQQVHHKTGETEIFALICLVKFNPRDRQGQIFGYKDMSETMGPYQADCPATILDLLGPTINEHALDWRVRCRAALARRNRKAPKSGDTIIFAQDMNFTDGSQARRFVMSTQGRKTIFTNPVSGGRYRISRWKDRERAVVPKIDVPRTAA